MARSIIEKGLNHRYFLVKFVKPSRKGFRRAKNAWLNAFDFRQCCRRTVSNICLGRPQIIVFNVSQDFWSDTIQR